MTKYGSADVGFVLVNGRNIRGTLTSLEDTREALIEDTTVLGASYELQSYVGVKRYSLSQQGFYDSDADSSNDALLTPGDGRVFSFAPEGASVGKKFVGALLTQATYTRQISRGALHKANATYESNGGADEGIILHSNSAAEVAAGNTEGASSQDAGAASLNGGAGYLQVSALTLGGYTSLGVKVRHSADDVTYADLVTFANVAAAPAAERKTVAGTVNRHLASSWAFNGVGAGPSATFVVGFARN